MSSRTVAAPAAQEAARLKIVIVGHVDHGKSTLVGRLFYDTDSIPKAKLDQIKKASELEGMDIEWAFLLDALLEEQAQNITIDTTQIQFRTAKRNYVIIDAPGHKEFLKNMVTGAASADAAILLIDAQEGVQEQSRRHCHLLAMLGIRQVIVAVNKMDLVGFSQERFDAIRAEYTAFLDRLDVQPSQFIPISAKHGENIIRPSAHMPWCKAPPILDALDAFEQPPSREAMPLRFVVQDVYRFDDRRLIGGRVEAGTLRVGDELVFWPDRKRSRIKSIEMWQPGPLPDEDTSSFLHLEGPDGATPPAPQEAVAGQSVAVTLTEQIFAERGQIASSDHDGPVEGREFRANVFWLSDEPLRAHHNYTLKLAAQTVEARVVRIERVIDSSSLDVTEEARAELRKNEVGEVVLRGRRPLAFDNGDRIPETGRFVLFAGQRIGGGGLIHKAQYWTEVPKSVASENITWTVGRVTRESRAEQFGHQGAVLWLTGLSGSGKSTLAIALEWALMQRGRASYILDGDNLRHGLCSDLGFKAEERAENIRRAGEVAKLMAEAGLIVITSLISPFTRERTKVREIVTAAGLPFAEIYVNAPLEECERRDPRHLYRRARAGEIKGFTGIDSPYEAPQAPELELRTDQLTVEASLDRLLGLVLGLTDLKATWSETDEDPRAHI